MSRRKNLYEIRKADGRIIEYSVTAQEAARLLNKTTASIYQAAVMGHKADRKYWVDPVDVQLSKSADWELLLEFDIVRQQLLKRARG